MSGLASSSLVRSGRNSELAANEKLTRSQCVKAHQNGRGSSVYIYDCVVQKHIREEQAATPVVWVWLPK